MKNIAFNYISLAIILVASPFLIVGYLRENPSFNAYTYIGLALIIPALILFTISRIQLGKSFQASAEANSLVTTGIYKKLRHPIYYFGLIFLLGFIILIQKFYLVIVWVAIIIMQIKRIKNEEKVLEEKFGAQYAEYKKGTWF